MVDEEIWEKHRRELDEEEFLNEELDEIIYIWGKDFSDD